MTWSQGQQVTFISVLNTTGMSRNCHNACLTLKKKNNCAGQINSASPQADREGKYPHHSACTAVFLIKKYFSASLPLSKVGPQCQGKWEWTQTQHISLIYISWPDPQGFWIWNLCQRDGSRSHTHDNKLFYHTPPSVCSVGSTLQPTSTFENK